MAQTIQQHTKQLDSGDSTATDYEWISGGAANTQTLIQAATIVNNDVVAQVVTIKIKNTSGTTVLSIDYTLQSGDSEIISELTGQALDGSDTTPEKVYVAFDTSLTGTDTIDCRASSVEFS